MSVLTAGMPTSLAHKAVAWPIYGPAGRNIAMELGGLDAFGQLAWLHYLSLLAAFSRGETEIVVNRNSLRSPVLEMENSIWRRWLPGVRLMEAGGEPVASTEFVFLSDARWLSAKLLCNFSCFHVEPVAPPSAIDPHLFWAIKAQGDPFCGLARMVEATGDRALKRRLEAYCAALRPARPRVAMISSVFNADEYLDQFLLNSAALHGYESCEHFLIRPGSPGNEHEALMAYVRRNPNTVYINMLQDPGLYEVWNLGVRLARSRYISNANVDDRRAPEHLDVLASYLDRNPSVDIASAELYVTQTPNLDWADTEGCPPMFGTDGDLDYGGQDLFSSVGGGFAARNYPHCMPVWRRELHALHGSFCEKEFGPSSDWEFWLRVAKRGHRFYFHRKPLGSHLKHPESYWRVGSRHTDFNARVIKKYIGGHDDSEMSGSLDIAEVQRLADYEAFLEVVGSLFSYAERIVGQCADPQWDIINSAGNNYLGVPCLTGLVDSVFWYKRDCRRTSDDIIELIVHCLHEDTWLCGECKPDSISARVLNGALMDLQLMAGEVHALVAQALLHRRIARFSIENQLLREAHSKGSREFWETLQRVYRFECSLEEIINVVGDNVRPEPRRLVPASKINLFYYPNYTGNLYQAELYRHLQEQGARITPVNDINELANLRVQRNAVNIVHLHWLNAVFKDIRPNGFAARAERFKGVLKDLRGKGFNIHWTVHNRLSHESVDPEQEPKFRNEVATLADRIYVHHPLAARRLDWLPECGDFYLCEHGPYPVRAEKASDREEARNSLGLHKSDVLLVCAGLIREYKGLDEYLPLLADMAQPHSSFHVKISGRIASRKLKAALSRIHNSNIVVDDRLVPDEELETLFHAADIGLLTYKEILTSGLMFHMLSAGLPVLAPHEGIIPAYVINGWNGFLYRSKDELKTLVESLMSREEQGVEYMRKNALRTAETLNWRFMSGEGR